MAGDEIWATHTNLDGFTFATVLGAVLANDTEVSFADDLNLVYRVLFTIIRVNLLTYVYCRMANMLPSRQTLQVL